MECIFCYSVIARGVIVRLLSHVVLKIQLAKNSTCSRAILDLLHSIFLNVANCTRCARAILQHLKKVSCNKSRIALERVLFYVLTTSFRKPLLPWQHFHQVVFLICLAYLDVQGKELNKTTYVARTSVVLVIDVAFTG